MKVYLDDRRPCPDGWVLASTAREAIALLVAHRVTDISLDHDLGDDDAGTGYDVAVWMEEAVATRGYVPPEISVHSANAVGRQRLDAAVASIRRFAAAASEAARPAWERLDAYRRRYVIDVIRNLAGLHIGLVGDEARTRQERLAGAFLIAIDVLESAAPATRAYWELVRGDNRSFVHQALRGVALEVQTGDVTHEALRLLDGATRRAIDGRFADAFSAAVVLLGGWPAV